MAISQPVLVGPYGTTETPDTIARKRALVRSMMMQYGKASNIGEGIAQLFNGIAVGSQNRAADAAEQAGIKSGNSAREAIFNMLSGGASAPSAEAPKASGSVAPVSRNATPVPGNINNARANDRNSVPGYAGLDMKSGIQQSANALGISPVDLATAISYETAGTMDPTKRGPTTQWGQHRGLIQFGEPQAQKYGVDWNNPISSQLGENGAVVKYLKDAGVQPGMGMLDVYSAINAGRVGRYNASDANNGGAPGTVADKVNGQMASHRAKAMAMFGDPAQSGSPFDAQPGMAATASPAMGYAGPAQVNSPPPSQQPVQVAQAAPQQQTMSDIGNAAFPPAPAPAPKGGIDLNMLMQQAQNPWLDDNSRAMVNNLIEQEITRQRQSSDPAYLRQQRMGDLAEQKARLELQKMQQPASQDDETFFGNPIAVQNPDGSMSYGQIGNKGSFRPIKLGDGQSFAPPTKTIDGGTENLIMDQAGNVVARVPKNVAQTEQQKAEGKAKAEAGQALRSVESSAAELLSSIDSLSKDPYLPNMVGAVDSWLPNMTSDAARVQSKMDQIGGQSFMQAFNSLKGSGQITEQEGAKATAALARLNTAQNEGDYQAALNEFRGVINRAVENARKAAGVTTDAPKGADDGNLSLDDLLKKY